MQPTIGIDVSKDRLDAYPRSEGQRFQMTNDRAGCKALIGWIGKAEPPLVVFEATGPVIGRSRRRSAPAVSRSPR